jgi:DAACS family dicarboxylate/amino acid:cation (Na+ or H+) symporter
MTDTPPAIPPLARRGRVRVPLYLQIIGAMVIGGIVGPLLGAGRAAPLGELGKLVIQLIKAVATPLLFFAIVNAILRTEVKGRAGVRMLVLASINACVAIAIGLLISNVFHPGQSLQSVAPPAAAPSLAAYADKKIDFIKTLAGYIPNSVVHPFVDNLILSIVLLALLLGFALRAVRGEPEVASGARTIDDAVAALLRVMEVVLGWVIRLVPVAVFGVVAKTVAEHGFAPLRGLGIYVAIGLAGMALHIALTYQLWIRVGARLPLRRFWGEAKEPAIYAAGANSSLATLPLTVRALDRLGVSRSSSTLGAMVGTNFNNDGIILYEGMAVLLVAQAHGLHLDLGQQLVAAGTCLVAAMGVAGVPEAGIISLALVLNTVGLPVDILPLLLTVDWILGRARSVTNVLSDMVLSIMIDRGRAARAPEAPAG